MEEDAEFSAFAEASAKADEPPIESQWACAVKKL